MPAWMRGVLQKKLIANPRKLSAGCAIGRSGCPDFFLATCRGSEQPRAVAPLQSLLCVGKRQERKRGRNMLWTIFVILLVLWLLGGFIHILLVIALVVLLIQLISGRRAV
jgi:hypothetical protein